MYLLYSARKTRRREICDIIKEAGMAATIICVKSKAKPSRQKKEIEKKKNYSMNEMGLSVIYR